jgi:hypothetical protein
MLVALVAGYDIGLRGFSYHFLVGAKAITWQFCCMSKVPHYEFFGGLNWTTSTVHQYELTRESGNLRLRAAIIDAAFASEASTLDHFIWDEMVSREDPSIWCETITVWTKSAEFNLLVFGTTDDKTARLQCAYFPTPPRKLCESHALYWKAVNVPMATKRGSNVPAGAARIHSLLPTLVIWNRYVWAEKKSDNTTIFTRQHAVAVDICREWFETIPIPTTFLEFEASPNGTAADKRALKLYSSALKRYAWVAGRGNPMVRNLITLSSLLADSKIRAALVTGEPGTGKEAYCKAIYFGNKLRRPADDKSESVFLETTALEIQGMMKGSNTPSRILKKKVAKIYDSSGPKDPANRAKHPVIFIDELNKAEDHLLAGLLRPLEQGEAELQVTGNPRFILAASQHIEDLAKKPPQDFWTRISHQLRVAHPLGRVSEEDAEVFLSSFFFSEWWNHVEEIVRKLSGGQRSDFVKVFFLEQKGRKWETSKLCDRVYDEFVNTLVPLVSRDILSVRGVRSILSQVFARLSWFVRYEKPFTEWDAATANQVARLVNSAVQDVLAILNAARATPASMGVQSGKKLNG